MKIKLVFNFQTTALYDAVEKGSFEIVQLLLAHENIHLNTQSILKLFFIKFKSVC